MRRICVRNNERLWVWRTLDECKTGCPLLDVAFFLIFQLLAPHLSGEKVGKRANSRPNSCNRIILPRFGGENAASSGGLGSLTNGKGIGCELDGKNVFRGGRSNASWRNGRGGGYGCRRAGDGCRW